MPVKTKRKAVKQEAPLTPKYERLRLREWMMFWILVAASIALVCAIFGDVDVRTLRPVGVTNSTSSSVDQQELDDLRAQVVNLGTQLSGMEQGAANGSDSGMLGTDPGFQRLCMSSELQVSTTYVSYIDQKTGVSMTLPYSLAENSYGCLVPTIRNDEDGIAFGPLVGSEGGSDQDSFIRILPVTSTTVILKELNTRTSDPENPVKNIRQRTINGLTVISHEETWAIGGGAKFWYAIGRNFSYEIGSLSALTDAEAIKIIQSLRVTK